MDIFSLFTLLGGLAFFIFGMNQMSHSLEKIAGNKMQSIINKATKNRFLGLLVGCVITIAIQSSSAVTVMLVGLVNSGLMNIANTVGIIMGSNIGTTITAWIMSMIGISSDNVFVRMLKPESFSPLLAFIGIVLNMVAKKTKHKAQTAAEMYSGRYDQLEKQEYISEKESDEVIDSLLQYEVQLELDFKKALADPLKKLAKIHADYMDAVEDTERTLTAWQQEIHANYNTRGAMARKDPQTGKITNRSERPVPVHQLPYNGCDEAAHLGLYLVKAAPLMN